MGWRTSGGPSAGASVSGAWSKRARANALRTHAASAGVSVPPRVRVTATGALPLEGVTRERIAGAAPAAISATPLTFTAEPVVSGQYRIAWAAGAVPAAGAASILEFRAAGVRLAVPVRSAADAAP